MTKRNDTYEYNRNNDPRDELGEVPTAKKIQNSILVVASIIYMIVMFLPVIYSRVYDASLVFTYSIFDMGTVDLFSIDIDRISEIFSSVGDVFSLVSIASVIMTFAFLVSSIINYIKYRNGDSSLFGRNVFFLISIPASYAFAVGNKAIFYQSSMMSIDYTPIIIALIAGGISAILLLIFGIIGKHRVSILSIFVIILAIVCFSEICAFTQNPIFDVSFEHSSGTDMSFELGFENFDNFYDKRGISDYNRWINKNGMVGAYINPDGKVDVCNSGALVNSMMMFLPKYLPSVMMISAVAMAISAFSVLAILIAMAPSSSKKNRGMIIAKISLAISTSAFAASLIHIATALNDVKDWLSKVETTPIAVNTSFHTLTLSVAQSPIIAIIAAIFLLMLNTKAISKNK
jgi:hypothetical protein